jgi:hypothetical protein
VYLGVVGPVVTEIGGSVDSGSNNDSIVSDRNDRTVDEFARRTSHLQEMKQEKREWSDKRNRNGLKQRRVYIERRVGAASGAAFGALKTNKREKQQKQ